MKTTTFSRQKRQFTYLSGRVNQLVLSGEWIKLSASTRNRIILKLNSLYRQLCSYFTQTELKKILAAAAIFIGLPLAIQAQSFAPPLLNPFWLAPDSVSLASPDYADIDHDGDFDLFTGNYGGFMQFYENTGTPAVPAFAFPQQNPFGIVTPVDNYHIAFPAFADIDHDGDTDLFIGGIAGDEPGYADLLQFYENTGTDVAPAFAAPQTNPFGLEPEYIFAMPAFADIDSDGDLDLFTGEGYGVFKFFENTGTVTEPEFAVPVQNPFGLTSVNTFGSPAFADTDHDGDLDLFVGEYYGNMQYFENAGTAGSPAFAPMVTNPFGLVQTNYYNFPAIADLDNDGDEDILIGEYYGSLQYFKNTEINTGIGEDPGEGFFSLYPNPATDGVYIVLKDEMAEYPEKYQILDMSGRIVQSGEVTGETMKIETGNLVPGLYIVRLTDDQVTYSRKHIFQ